MWRGRRGGNTVLWGRIEGMGAWGRGRRSKEEVESAGLERRRCGECWGVEGVGLIWLI